MRRLPRVLFQLFAIHGVSVDGVGNGMDSLVSGTPDLPEPWFARQLERYADRKFTPAVLRSIELVYRLFSSAMPSAITHLPHPCHWVQCARVAHDLGATTIALIRWRSARSETLRCLRVAPVELTTGRMPVRISPLLSRTYSA